MFLDLTPIHLFPVLSILWNVWWQSKIDSLSDIDEFNNKMTILFHTSGEKERYLYPWVVQLLTTKV
jgi:hypothetical protein